MLALQRQREILLSIARNGVVRVSDLARTFRVAEETIRRDLDTLEKAGRITRTHGGAILAEAERHEVPHQQREVIHPDAKSGIAAEALKRVKGGDSIMLDASSTACFLARLLPDEPLTVVTNSIMVIQALSAHRQIKVLSIGGTFAPVTMSLQGHRAIRNLESYHVDVLFFSCRGIDRKRGLSDASDAAAQIKQGMLKVADQRILLADHSKFGVRALSQVAPCDAVHEIITDAAAPPDLEEWLPSRGVQLTRCQPDPLSLNPTTPAQKGETIHE